MRRVTFLLVVLLAVPAGVGPGQAVGPAAGQSNESPCAGTMAAPAGGTTVISVQGARGQQKTDARLVAVGPRGRIKWVHSGPEDVVWLYDVDPLDNGNLFVVGTVREGGHGKTLLYEFDPRTQERVWTERVNVTDTHDADLLDDGRIAIANMRAYDHANGTTDDRLVVYNRSTGTETREWLFRDHYPERAGGDYVEDWTHVNDVDRVNESHYLLSPRNFDQVILVDVETGAIELQLGSDDDRQTLERQHNPQYLETGNGTPTFLVADSGNDRVVEYERTDDGWNRTWMLGTGGSFDWPRDADRLPNGNTLVTDSRNNRVLEVTPSGETVWEVYAPWLVYDAERVRVGDDDAVRGPTIAEMNAAGSEDLTNAPLRNESAQASCAAVIDDVEPGSVREISTATSAEAATATGTATAAASPTTEQPGFDPLAAIGAVAAIGALFASGRDGSA